MKKILYAVLAVLMLGGMFAVEPASAHTTPAATWDLSTRYNVGGVNYDVGCTKAKTLHTTGPGSTPGTVAGWGRVSRIDLGIMEGPHCSDNDWDPQTSEMKLEVYLYLYNVNNGLLVAQCGYDSTASFPGDFYYNGSPGWINVSEYEAFQVQNESCWVDPDVSTGYGYVTYSYGDICMFEPGLYEQCYGDMSVSYWHING